VSVFFNGIFKREVRTRLAGVLNDVQEHKSAPQIKRVQERQLCAALVTKLNATVCTRGLWLN
jgi:hypothetical protein